MNGRVSPLFTASSKNSVSIEAHVTEWRHTLLFEDIGKVNLAKFGTSILYFNLLLVF